MDALHQELVFLNLDGLKSEDVRFIEDTLSVGSEVIVFPWETRSEPNENVPCSNHSTQENVEDVRNSQLKDQPEYYECEAHHNTCEETAVEHYPAQNVSLGPPSSSVSQVHLHYPNPIMYSHVGLAGYPASIPMVAAQPNAYVSNMATTLNMPGLTSYPPQPRPVNTIMPPDKFLKRVGHSPNKRGKNFMMGMNGHMQDQYNTSVHGYVPNHGSYVSQSYGATYYSGHPTVQSATGAPYFMQTTYPSSARFMYSPVATTASPYTPPVVTVQNSMEEVATESSAPVSGEPAEEIVNEVAPVTSETEAVSSTEVTAAEEPVLLEPTNEPEAAEEPAVHEHLLTTTAESTEVIVQEEAKPVEVTPTPAAESQQPQQKTWASLFKSRTPAAAAASKTPETTASQTNAQDTQPKAANNLITEVQTSTVSTADPIMQQLATHLAGYALAHSSVALLPRGLTNKNNWCYINASLQALLACPPFVHLIKSLSSWAGHRLAESTTPIMDGLVEFMSQFETIPVRSRKDRAAAKKEELMLGACFEPSSILKLLSNIRSETFKVEGRQEDAEEFLSCLLNGLHDEMVEVLKLVPAAASSTSSATAHNGVDLSNVNGDDEWQLIGPKNRSCVTRSAIFNRTPISDLFLGQMRSAIYQAGSQTTATLQPFFSLQLDIQSERVRSVREALEALVAKEPLTGYVCSKTGQEVEALRQTTLEELPPVLLLHLKCFVYNKSGGCQKLAKPIEFSADLELGKELLSPNLKNKVKERQRQYKLFAVVYHDGKEATKGHYVTEVLHSGLKTWLRFDDSLIRPIPDGSLFKYKEPRMPYLLFYRRADTLTSPAAASRSAVSTSPAVSSSRGAHN